MHLGLQPDAAWMIFNFYLFSRRGACLYYAEWERPHSTLKDMPDEDRKLMFGYLLSLKSLMNKMNPSADPTPSQLPSFGPESGFYRYATDSYTLFHFEAPTGYKLAITCDAGAGDLRGALWTIYADIFCAFALKNPLYVPGTRIRSVGFTSTLEAYVRGLPGFASRAQAL